MKHNHIHQLHQDFGYFLHKSTMLSDRVGDQLFLKEVGITTRQYLLLQGLDVETGKGPSQQDIAEHLSTTKSAISRQILIARQQGLVDAKLSLLSRRENRIFLTEKGHAVLKEARELNDNFETERLGDITDKDLEITVKTLKKVCELLEHKEKL